MANKIHIVNTTNDPRTIRRHEHLCQVHLTTAADSTSDQAVTQPPPHHCHSGSQIYQSGLFSNAVTVDPDNILPDGVRNQFRTVLQAHDDVFNPTIVGYKAPLALLRPLKTWVLSIATGQGLGSPVLQRYAGRVTREI